MPDTPNWRIAGDWFDNCSCDVACPCTFARAPDNNFCESVLFWHIKEGHYGDVVLDDLAVVRVGRFDGDLWAGKVAETLVSLSTIEPMMNRLKPYRQYSVAVQAGFQARSTPCLPGAAKS